MLTLLERNIRAIQHPCLLSRSECAALQQRMQKLLRTGFRNQAAASVRCTRSKPLIRVGPHGIELCRTYCKSTVCGSAIADSCSEVESLKQSKDSWRLSADKTSSDVLPRLLLVDGTNLACLCAGGRHKSRSVFSDRVEGVWVYKSVATY